MSYNLFVVLAFSIFLPVITGLIKIRQIISHQYLPVFLFVAIGLLNNLASYIFIKNGISNHLNSNIYVAIEFGLLVWQFLIWREGAGRNYILVLGVLLLVWFLDNLIIHDLRRNNSIFRFFSAFTVLFFCVGQINQLIFFHYRRLITNPVFLICIGLMLHYTFKAFVETFYFFSWMFEIHLIIQLNRFISFVDLISNILISIAFLCLRNRSTYYLS